MALLLGGKCHVQHQIYFPGVSLNVFYSTESSDSELESDASADFEEEVSDTSSESSDWATGDEDSDCDDANSGTYYGYHIRIFFYLFT